MEAEGQPTSPRKLEEDVADEGVASPSTSTLDAPPITTSTVSTPVAPLNRDELEERYNKLKTIAVKLKKRITEQNSEIEGLKEEKSRFQNASKIQQEFDKAQDEIERLRKSETILQKDLEKAIEENVRLKMNEAEASAQIQSLSSSHKVLREKLEKLEKESEETQDLKSKVETLEKELQEAKDAGVDAQQEKRQLQILSLEVTDYERKLQEAYGSYEEKKVECEELLKELNTKDKKTEELETRIVNLKDSENQLILAKESLQADVVRKADKITFLQEEVSKFNERLNETKSHAQKLQEELENAKSNFVSQTKEFSEEITNSQKIISNLEQKVSTLEENKRSRETQIANLKLEMQQLESDYSSYKIKAQAMLKSQRPMTQTEEKDELENLQRVVQDFHCEVSVLKSQLNTMKLENESLSVENTELNVRISQLKTDAVEKDVQASNEIQRLRQDIREKDELLRSRIEEAKLEMESTIQSFTVQMESLKLDYESQIQYFREQCEILKSTAATNEFQDLRGSGVDNMHRRYDVQKDPSTHMPPSAFRPVTGGRGSPPSDQQGLPNRVSQPLTIDTSGLSFDQLRMIPRGEGEGSESVGSTYTPRVDNYNISFEQLLSTSFDSISKNSDSDQEKPSRDTIDIRNELSRSQSQVNHLTSLLRESEANCDRLTQLSEALKEEIRRIERDKERQGHLKENTEYLKNVLLKFVTLSAEDERQRLIPVLKTMLRLTNEEVAKLELVIKGKDRIHIDGTGWSSYLPRWSSDK